jgi:putative ATP-dependent endonuclease of OLD family
MQLDRVTISGFRGYGDAITVDFEHDTTTVIGRNDAGKSSVFEALEVFFGGKLELTDFTVGVDAPIEITCSFSALPEVVVLDTDRDTSLAAEYLLDRDGRLSLKKTWTRSKLTAATVAARASHPIFPTDSDLLNSKLTALKSRATAMGITDTEIGDRRTSSAYRKAIWDQGLASGEAELQDVDVALTSDDGKSVATALSGYLPLFHLFRSDRPGSESDKIAQDPANAAVKAVLEEHESELEALSQTVQRQVGELLSDVVERLSEVAPQLAASLTPIDPSPVWSKAFSSLQFVDEHGVPLSKRGSGTRRLVLLSFFRATAERGLDLLDKDPNEYRRGVITAVEEPETALHADLQTDIVSALQDVGELPHRQVLLTTHSSNLIRLVPARSIRYISGTGLSRKCIQVGPDDDATALLAELNRSLGVFTDHNVRCFLLIEGRNDVDGLKILTSALQSAGVDGVRAFSDLESEGLICFMPIGGGGSASLWNSNLSPFKRHEVHVMDSDRESASGALKIEMTALLARADEKRHVYVLDRRELENYLTEEAVLDAYTDLPGFASSFRAAISASGHWDYLDLPLMCAQIAHALGSSTGTAWDDLPSDTRKSKEGRVKKRLAKAFSHPSVPTQMAAENNDALSAIRTVTTLAAL